MIYLKVISLIICLWWTAATAINVNRGRDIEWYAFLIPAIGWTTFIFSMGWLNLR